MKSDAWTHPLLLYCSYDHPSSCHWSFICWRFGSWFNRNQVTFENRCLSLTILAAISNSFDSACDQAWHAWINSHHLLHPQVCFFFGLQTAIKWWPNQIPLWEILAGSKLCPQHSGKWVVMVHLPVFEVLDWNAFQLAPCQQYKLRASKHLMTSFRRARHTFSALWPLTLFTYIWVG